MILAGIIQAPETEKLEIALSQRETASGGTGERDELKEKKRD